MATLLTHAFAGAILADIHRPSERCTRWWIVAALCSMLPDLDVIGFAFGVRYGDLWGHRGMTHSLLFAAMVGFAAAWFVRQHGKFLTQGLSLFLITTSHAVLDAMTNGGLGVAFFSPIDRHRYFFNWRPIAVSPIGTHGLASSRMAHILITEILWVWIPISVVWMIAHGFRRVRVTDDAGDFAPRE